MTLTLDYPTSPRLYAYPLYRALKPVVKHCNKAIVDKPALLDTETPEPYNEAIRNFTIYLSPARAKPDMPALEARTE